MFFLSDGQGSGAKPLRTGEFRWDSVTGPSWSCPADHKVSGVATCVRPVDTARAAWEGLQAGLTAARWVQTTPDTTGPAQVSSLLYQRDQRGVCHVLVE